MSPPTTPLSAPPRALIRDQSSDDWLVFDEPLACLRADTPAAVRDVVAAAEEATEHGRWAVGFCCYEAATAFDPALATRPAGALPLAWFALCEPPRILPTALLPEALDATVVALEPSLTAAEHAEGVQRIRHWIARGDTYQVNYTHLLHGHLDGDPWGLFRSLERGQRSPYAAWLDIGSHLCCSASPELFFALDGDRLLTRPMKGTTARGRTTAEDRVQALALASSAKDRAENVMIVDMIRNDLGRVADAGSVRTTRLFEIERYETVFQMTSTIEARTRASVGEIFGALFPCASITGAPKVRTTELIARLETAPRGLYTGAIGWMAPDRRSRFSVAIRTATVCRTDGALEYGTGGGIVWDSAPGAEYSECGAKARILTAPWPRFELLETLLWEPERGYALLDRHLDRLADSADYFGFALDRKAIACLLESAATAWSEPQRVRLTVPASGDPGLSRVAAPTTDEPVRIVLAAAPVDSRDPFLFHKTTHRTVYDAARAGRPDGDDVLLWNERRELTESTIANLVLEIAGERLTPPVASGLLAGTLRAELLARGEISERILTLDDLRSASAIHLANSVRGLVPAELLDP